MPTTKIGAAAREPASANRSKISAGKAFAIAMRLCAVGVGVVGELRALQSIAGVQMLERALRIADVEIGLAERKMERDGLAACSRFAACEPSLHRRERRVARLECDEVGERLPGGTSVLIELGDAPQLGPRFVGPTGFGMRRGARHQRLPPRLAAHRNRLIVTSEGFRRAIKQLQHFAASDQRVGVVRPQRQRAVEGGERLS